MRVGWRMRLPLVLPHAHHPHVCNGHSAPAEAHAGPSPCGVQLCEMSAGSHMLRRLPSAPKFTVWKAGAAEESNLMGLLGGRGVLSLPAAAQNAPAGGGKTGSASRFDLHAAMSSPCVTSGMTQGKGYVPAAWTEPSEGQPRRIPYTFPPKPGKK